MSDSAVRRITYLSLADLYPPDRYGGSERVIEELSRALVTTGHASGIMAGGKTRSDPSVECSLPIWRFPVTPAPLPVLLMSIFEQYRRLPALPLVGDGTVLVHHRMSGWAAHRTGKLKNNHSISFFYGPIDREWVTQWKGSKKTTPRAIASPLLRTMIPPLLKSIQKTTLSSSDAVVTLGEYTRQQAEDILGGEYPPVHVIRPGVDHTRFSPPPDKGLAKEALGVDPSKTVLLSVRRLVPRMGLENLLESFAILAGNDTSFHLVIVGSGPKKDWLEETVHEKNLSDSVTVQGYIEDGRLPDYYRAADLFVLPSIDLEGFGLVTLEAMACGVPVVATGIGESIYLLRDADDISRLVPPDEPKRMALACEEMLPVAPEISNRCISFARDFTWEAMAEAVHDLSVSLK